MARLRRKRASQYVSESRTSKWRVPRLDDGDTVPRTGYYYLEANTRIIPRKKKRSGTKRDRSR